MAKSKGRRRKPKKEEETLIDIVEAKESVQSFFERNRIKVIGTAAFVLLVIAGYFGYQMLYQGPRQKEAMEQLFKAEYQFQQDSFALALENPGGGYYGFLDIVEQYNGTKASNLAKYYAGISYLNLGRFEDAVTYLKAHNGKGSVTSITKYGALGDAYSELNQYDEAIAAYEKAVSGDSYFLTPYYLQKLGLLCQRQGLNDQALKAFERIEKEYPKSVQAADVGKYISMLNW